MSIVSKILCKIADKLYPFIEERLSEQLQIEDEAFDLSEFRWDTLRDKEACTKALLSSPQNNNLTKKDIYCIAKLLQSAFFSQNFTDDKQPDFFYGCSFCKFSGECQNNNFAQWDRIREVLEKQTGVDLDLWERPNKFADNKFTK